MSTHPKNKQSILGYLKKSFCSEFLSFDHRSLVLFRVGVGVSLLISLCIRSKDVIAHYSSSGLFPAPQNYDFPRFVDGSILFYNDRPVVVVSFFILSFFIFLFYTAGYKPKLFGVLSFIALITLQNRFLGGNHSGDDMLRIFLLWSLVMPICSYPEITKKAKKALSGVVTQKTIYAMYLVQLALIYIAAFLAKSGNLWRSDFTALEYVYNTEYLTKEVGNWLLNFPDLLKLMTAGSLVIEFTLPILILSFVFVKRARYAAVILAVLLHMSIFLTMRVGIFPAISIAIILPLIPGSFYDAKLFKQRQNSRINLLRIKIVKAVDSFSINHKWLQKIQTRLGFLPNLMKLAAVIYATTIITLNVLQPYVGGISPSVGSQATKYNLDQNWGVFAPNPPQSENWLIITGFTPDGQLVDVWHYYWSGSKSSEVLVKPDLYDSYINSHWQKLLEKASRPAESSISKALARYACQNWNDQNLNHQLEWVDVFAKTENTSLGATESQNSITVNTIFTQLACN